MKHRRILVSPTAFKGTLSPDQAARIIQAAFLKKLNNVQIKVLPLADGGDGTLEVLLRALQGRRHRTRVTGPLGQLVLAEWGSFKNSAVIEMARASGLALVKGKKRPLVASSIGTGQLMKAVLDKGYRRILMGVGGTASSDGGAGALQALGLRYLDQAGRVLKADPKSLLRLDRVDWADFDSRLRKTKIFVLCDVRNPLLGPQGSARTFSPQKGASPHQVLMIERFLSHWSRFARRDVKNKAGAGAAGALAFGLAGFAGARLVAGAPFIMKTVGWKKKARHATDIVTGEGQFDRTSLQGKVVGEILKQRGTSQVHIICGRAGMFGRFSVVEMGAKGRRRPKESLIQAAEKLAGRITSSRT